MEKAVFQIENIEIWPKALSRANNLLQAASNVSEELDLAIVAQGSAVRYYKKMEKHSRLFQELKEKGVRFVACKNALDKERILELELDEDVSVVPAGIYELVKLQREGYGYIYLG